MSNVLFSYLSPDQMIPLATPITAGLGFVLVSWRYVATFLRKKYRQFIGLQEPSTAYGEFDVLSMSGAMRLQPEVAPSYVDGQPHNHMRAA